MYALVDCNNFYCSCESLFQPQLRGRPVVVLSNNDGCVISRSEEAKALGIKMGAPAHLLEKAFTEYNVNIFSSNYTLYGDISDRVMETLLEWIPAIEKYSIDEAFLDLQPFHHINFFELALALRKKVGQNIGIPVTVGMAPTKTLAKMANKLAKKKYKDMGCFLAADDDCINEMLEFTEVGDIWGIGPQYARFLVKHGFNNALQLKNAPEEWVRSNMTVVGQRLLNELKGQPSIEWQAEAPDKKNICIARGFGHLIKTKKELAEALANYAASCAEKLRHQRSCCSMINVFIQTNAFRPEDQQYMRSMTVDLPVATNNTSKLIAQAMSVLDRIYKDGYNYHKAGITVMKLVPEHQVQYGIYDVKETIKEKNAMTEMDKLNRHFGKDLIRVARQGYNEQWKLRQMRLSPKYTTRIDEILKVNI